MAIGSISLAIVTSSIVRVMFDCESNKLVVTVDVACTHNLKLLRKEWLSISMFGRKTTKLGLHVVLIDLIPVSGGGNLNKQQAH
jgi:hypothetical protein